MDLFDELIGNEISDDGENLEQSNERIQTNQEDNENGSDDGREDEEKKVKPKRIIRHPRAKLNAELLKGPKGLGNLEKCFERVHFKGKGYEEQDLNVLLKTYEYWCHRLFPKYPFKDCIDKIEKLGSKGPIQTYLKKVRSGMVDDETETTDVLPEFKSDEEDEPAPSNKAQSSTQATMADIPIELTEEQLETIRRNREKAEKLRQERLRKIQEKALVNLPEKNVLSEASTSTRRISSEISRDDTLRIQSNSGPDRNLSPENGDDSNYNKSGVNKGANSPEQKNDSDSEDEYQFSKKKSKKPFDDDDEEEESTAIVEKEVTDEECNKIDADPCDSIEEEDGSNLSRNNEEIVEPMEVDEETSAKENLG